MNRFLALIMMAAMALFVAGPAMAQDTNGGGLTVNKSVDNSNTANTTFNTDVTVTKDVDINISSGEEPIPATGSVNVSGDSIFKELDVNVQDQENVVKFFELDDSAHSSWSISGTGAMSVAEQLQNGLDNVADIKQNPLHVSGSEMNVGLQYQVGIENGAFIAQGTPRPPNGGGPNNFAKQIQIGELNGAFINQP